MFWVKVCYFFKKCLFWSWKDGSVFKAVAVLEEGHAQFSASTQRQTTIFKSNSKEIRCLLIPTGTRHIRGCRNNTQTYKLRKIFLKKGKEIHFLFVWCHILSTTWLCSSEYAKLGIGLSDIILENSIFMTNCQLFQYTKITYLTTLKFKNKM